MKRMQRQRRQPARDQLVRVGAKRDTVRNVANEPSEPFLDPLRLLETVRPLVVNVLGRLEPGPLLGLEADIRPSLVRMAGEQDALTDAEA